MNHSLQTVDLNIDNYDLDDLLNLFKIPRHFDESDLKRAKKTVLMMHPDKSNLPSSYFLFYSKAYKMVYHLYEFKRKGNKSQNTDYQLELDHTTQNTSSVDSKQIKNFQHWFNSEFEKHKDRNDPNENGYQSWLESNDSKPDSLDAPSSLEQMARIFDSKKETARSLIIKKDIGDLETVYKNSLGSSSMLSMDAPSDYDSDLFSSLPYQDLKKAHEETVIPVTDEDYRSKPTFRSVNDLMQYRGSQDIKPLSESQAKEFLEYRRKKDDDVSMKRAFDLANQTEKAKTKNQEFMSSFRLLKTNKQNTGSM